MKTTVQPFDDSKQLAGVKNPTLPDEVNDTEPLIPAEVPGLTSDTMTEQVVVLPAETEEGEQDRVTATCLRVAVRVVEFMLQRWFPSPPYVAVSLMGPSLPNFGVKVTEQLLPERVHCRLLNDPRELWLKVAFPEGINDDSFPAFVTVTVHAAPEPTGTLEGEQLTEVSVASSPIVI